MNYIIYARKSSEDDGKQVQSIENQLRILKEYSEKQELTVVGTVIESKTAAEDGKRREFQTMLNKFRMGEANGLLVTHIDRISRNEIDSGEIAKLLGNGTITHIRTPQRIYSNTPEDLMMLGIEFVFSALYSRKLSVRVKEGIDTKLKKGEYPSFSPLGYLNVENGIIPDPDRAHFISLAFELYATGEYSLMDITNILYDKGFRSRTSQKVYKGRIQLTLRNPEYYGVIRRKGHLYSGSHQPLISKPLFDKVQKTFERTTRPQEHTHSFPFRDFMTCAECGCKLTATIKKGKHTYYYCTNGKGKCFQHHRYLTDSQVTEAFRKQFNLFPSLLQGKIAQLALRVYSEDLRKQGRLDLTAQESLRNQLALVARKTEGLLDALISKRISGEVYDKKLKELESEKATLQTQLKNLKVSDVETTLERIEKLIEKAISLPELITSKKDEVKRETLNSVLWNATIKDGEITSRQYKVPYSLIAEIPKNADFEIWRRGRDSNSREPCGSSGFQDRRTRPTMRPLLIKPRSILYQIWRSS